MIFIRHEYLPSIRRYPSITHCLSALTCKTKRNMHTFIRVICQGSIFVWCKVHTHLWESVIPQLKLSVRRALFYSYIAFNISHCKWGLRIRLGQFNVNQVLRMPSPKYYLWFPVQFNFVVLFCYTWIIHFSATRVPLRSIRSAQSDSDSRQGFTHFLHVLFFQ